ncbi:MAG TPA: HAMP domain-containing sensor histidine kinase [Ilumatobacter sp.]|nr:HAMP domain-containing sensor histidine kinase [Ilumatobacter sp.]
MRRRVLLAVLLTTTLAVVAFFVPASVAIHNAQRRGELLELQREASIVANRLANLAVNDAEELQAILDAHHPLALYSTDGQLLVGTGPSAPDRIVQLALRGNFAEGYVGSDLVAAVPVSATPAHPPLVVRIEEPNTESQQRYYRSLALLAGAALLILTVAAAVGVLVANRLNRPIDELKEWAGSRPSSKQPPPDPTGIDELDSLRSALVGDHTRIEELLERERSFSSQVSHQLRTPVAAMRVAVETELAAPRPDASAVLHESLGQLDRLESTISSLLALARHTERERIDCDMVALCRKHVSHWAEAVARDGRRLIVGGDAIHARVDVDAIGHVLDVLVDNALHHGKGDIHIDVHVDVHVDVRADVRGHGAAVAIDVSDEGPAPTDRDPFADTGSDSTHGIGLRLARTLAESSHGRLELLTTENTTFRLTVPV